MIFETFKIMHFKFKKFFSVDEDNTLGTLFRGEKFSTYTIIL